MILTIKIEVSDKIEAYNAVNRLNIKYKVLEADYDGKTYEFDEKVETKRPNYFLSEQYNEKLSNKGSASSS